MLVSDTDTCRTPNRTRLPCEVSVQVLHSYQQQLLSYFTQFLFPCALTPEMLLFTRPFEAYATKKINIKTINHNILHLFMQQVLIILQTDGYTEGGSAR
jgi:hypothetical protein